MGNLKENKDVRQRPEEGWRRWFLNTWFDLILWYDKPEGVLIGYQICYDKQGKERAVTWDGKSFSHRVVTGKNKLGISGMASSVLAQDAGELDRQLIPNLTDQSGELPPLIFEKILNDLRKEYSTV